MKTATKMYLSVVLSTLCIMFYQYQLSKANFITSQRNIGGSNAIISDSGIASGHTPLVSITIKKLLWYLINRNKNLWTK